MSEIPKAVLKIINGEIIPVNEAAKLVAQALRNDDIQFLLDNNSLIAESKWGESKWHLELSDDAETTTMVVSGSFDSYEAAHEAAVIYARDHKDDSGNWIITENH